MRRRLIFSGLSALSAFTGTVVRSTQQVVLFAPVMIVPAATGPVSGMANTNVASRPGPRGVTAQPDSTRDAIQRLQARLDAGELTLPYDSALGYLPALLHVLKIPTSSQALVFSRTSLQTDLIAPWSPRAVYFNDDVYIGYVPESTFLEVAVASPSSGAVFYTLNQDPGKRPQFTHEPVGCLQCHLSRGTGNSPGFIMLSTLVDRDGYAITGVHNGSTTDATPIAKRFGGWFVTGTHGKDGHSGNVFSPRLYRDIADKEQYLKDINLRAESARIDLAGKVSTTRYIARYSDIVALMVLVHQTFVHNLISTLHSAARHALIEQAIVARSLGDTTSSEPLENSNAKFRVAIDNLVRAMLFIDEPPFIDAIHESTSFTRDFALLGPRDKQGRSLRDFDLQGRLFRYPLSFLIYSEGFDALPDVARTAVYRRIRALLNGDVSNSDFAKLSARDRKAVSEILSATKPEYVKLGALR